MPVQLHTASTVNNDVAANPITDIYTINVSNNNAEANGAINTNDREYEHEGVLRYFITRQQQQQQQPSPKPSQQQQQCNDRELLSLNSPLPSSHITTTPRCSPYHIYPHSQASPNKPVSSERQSNPQSNNLIPVKSLSSLHALANMSCSPSFMLVSELRAITQHPLFLHHSYLHSISGTHLCTLFICVPSLSVIYCAGYSPSFYHSHAPSFLSCCY